MLAHVIADYGHSDLAEEGALALAPGSSGWTGADGEETRFMELFLRGGSAWESFGRPDVGARVQIGAGPEHSA